MVFTGISKVFSLADEQQYETIGRFWDEMALQYGLENLQGLGYNWENNTISYAIGLKNAPIPDFNLHMELPDCGWVCVMGRTDDLKQIYDEIYKDGPLQFEIEIFDEAGNCRIQYYRPPKL